MVLSSYFVTLIILEGVFARVPPPQRKPDVRVSKCSWRGNSYPLDREGKFSPSPCLSCKCDKGRAVCRSVKCGPRTCVDAEFDPNQCCLVCPTGDNCAYKAGVKDVMIKKGESYHPDKNTVCRCPELSFYNGQGGGKEPRAVCQLNF